jgi:hypothetical protein
MDISFVKIKCMPALIEEEYLSSVPPNKMRVLIILCITVG